MPSIFRIDWSQGSEGYALRADHARWGIASHVGLYLGCTDITQNIEELHNQARLAQLVSAFGF